MGIEMLKQEGDFPVNDGAGSTITPGYLQSVCARELEGLRAWTEVRHWRLVVTAAATALSIFISFPGPRWGDLDMKGRAWKALGKQIGEPFKPRDYPPETHQAKMSFRLTVPLFVRMTGIGIRGAAALHLVSGVALLYLTVSLAFAATGDRVTAALAALATASTYLGASAFWDTRGYFDALAICFLLAAMSCRSAPLVGSFVLLGAFTDERALVAALFVHLWFVTRGLLREGSSRRVWMPGPSWGILAAAAVYAGLRWFLAHRFGLATPVGEAALVGLGPLRGQFGSFPFGVWSILEGLWLPVLAAIGLLWTRFRLVGACLTGVLVALVLGAHCVWDVTRSGMYVFPVVFIAAAALADREARQTLRATYLLSALVCALTPTGHLQANEVLLTRPLFAWIGMHFW